MFMRVVSSQAKAGYTEGKLGSFIAGGKQASEAIRLEAHSLEVSGSP